MYISQELGFPGVQIGSHINEWNLDASELQPVFAVSSVLCHVMFDTLSLSFSPSLSVFSKAAEELGATIFIHPWDMQLDGRMKKYWLPWLVGMDQ